MARHILERFLSKPAATGLSKGDQDAIRIYLSGLDEQKKGLAAAAFDYVINDGSDSVLLEIAAAQNGIPLVQSGYMAKPTRRIDWENAGRRIFGALEGWDARAVKRLGEVLAINEKHLTGTAACPDFFRALVHYTVVHVNRHPSDPHAAGRLFDGARCLELLALGDADQAAVVDALFAEHALGRWGGDGRKRLLTMSVLAEALAAAPERTLFGARALDANGRCGFIDFLGNASLASQPAFFDFLFEAIAHGGKQQGGGARRAQTLRCGPDHCAGRPHVRGRADRRAPGRRVGPGQRRYAGLQR